MLVHLGGTMMLHRLQRFFAFVATAFVGLAAVLTLAPGASAQTGESIKIGYSMALTGGLAPNGKSALLAQKIWEEDINAKGGLLGRPVKLIYYDDQSNASTVPGIYTKLLDVDKVDLVLGPSATALAAPAMPVIMQKGKPFISPSPLHSNPNSTYPPSCP